MAIKYFNNNNNTLRFMLAFLLLLPMLGAWGKPGKPTKVIVVGASITEGYGTDNWATDAFPARLGQFLGDGYVVENYGLGGTTMLKHGNFPYWEKGPLDKALASEPDIVIIDLGGNDAKAVNRPYFGEFVNDACELVEKFEALPSFPRVILLTPIVSFYPDENEIWDPCIVEDVIPRVLKAGVKAGVEVIDMHPVLDKFPELMPDGVHPNNVGAKMMGKHICDYLQAHPDRPIPQQK